MGEMYDNLSKEGLSVAQKDKKISIISIDVFSKSELFSKYFCMSLYSGILASLFFISKFTPLQFCKNRPYVKIFLLLRKTSKKANYKNVVLKKKRQSKNQFTQNSTYSHGNKNKIKQTKNNRRHTPLYCSPLVFLWWRNRKTRRKHHAKNRKPSRARC